MAAYQVATHPGFAHGSIGGLPRPVDAAQLITGLYKHSPAPFEDAQGTPALEVPMPRAVIAERCRQLVPLAAGAQAKDEAIEHLAQIDPPMPLGRGGLDFIEDLLAERPHIIRSFPNGGLRRCLHDPSPGLCHTGGLSSDEAL
jgi:hypothetical protein